MTRDGFHQSSAHRSIPHRPRPRRVREETVKSTRNDLHRPPHPSRQVRAGRARGVKSRSRNPPFRPEVGRQLCTNGSSSKILSSRPRGQHTGQTLPHSQSPEAVTVCQCQTLNSCKPMRLIRSVSLFPSSGFVSISAGLFSPSIFVILKRSSSNACWIHNSLVSTWRARPNPMR